MARAVRVKLEATPQSAATARAALHNLDLEPETYADVALLVTELVATAFGSGERRPGEHLELIVELHAVARVEVRDPSGALAHADEEVRSADTLRGMLLARLASRWGVVRDPECTILWFEVEPGHERGRLFASQG